MNKFSTFFNNYSKNVDKADNLYFWKLSDELIEEIIINNLPKRMNKNSLILDAGGGTGRWILKLSDFYPSSFILYDLSDEMLYRARKNLESKNLSKRVKIIKGDLGNMQKIPSESVNHVISIYNPISFVDKPEKAVSELYRVLSKNGILIIMGQGLYNGIYSKINNYLAGGSELDKLYTNHKIKWNDTLPELRLFSKESLEGLLLEAGFKIKKSYGVPVFMQPGPEDFDSTNKLKSKISSKLEHDPKFYQSVKKIEKKFNSVPSVVNRGMNILTVAIKSS